MRKIFTMRLNKLMVLAVLTGILWSCGAPKVLVSEKANAEMAAAAGKYELAAQAWKTHIAATPIEEVEGSDFAKAAQWAYKSGDANLAVNWFDQARYKNYADQEMYLTLAEIFKSQKNISKELTALEVVKEKYPENLPLIGKRLMEIYHEIKLPGKALESWNVLDNQTKSELPVLQKYFDIKKEMKDSLVCDSVSLVILEKDAKNVAALEWNADKYYWMGENRYQREMDNYNRNKTTRQYRVLLKELDLATADMKKALTYLEPLWEIQKEPKYASYFANIYARFGDEKKAKYYSGFIQK